MCICYAFVCTFVYKRCQNSSHIYSNVIYFEWTIFCIEDCSTYRFLGPLLATPSRCLCMERRKKRPQPRKKSANESKFSVSIHSYVSSNVIIKHIKFSNLYDDNLFSTIKNPLIVFSQAEFFAAIENFEHDSFQQPLYTNS